MNVLDPTTNSVVEACAGSGKTWLLVSRMIRLLLAGAAPSELLAITFTRKAAEEMRDRLFRWLELLATSSEARALAFLMERGLDDAAARAVLPAARALFESVMLAVPGPMITTFHGWFLQLLARAPLSERPPASLMEDAILLRDEAWASFAQSLGRRRQSPEAQALRALLSEDKQGTVEGLLFAFLARRAEWWAWSQGRADPLADSVEALAALVGFGEDRPVLEELLADTGFAAGLREYQPLLEQEGRGIKEAMARAEHLRVALDMIADSRAAADSDTPGPARNGRNEPEWLAQLESALLTGGGQARAWKSSQAMEKRLGAAGAARFIALHHDLCARLLAVREQMQEIAGMRLNRLLLTVGVPFLDHFQRLKAERDGLDFTDAEWLAWRLMADPDSGPALMAKLDVRWKHILLDEFQDTNPLQWQILSEWLRAYGADGERPSLFMVGDPKQSIYRFRRAEPRLFAAARQVLEHDYQAAYFPNHSTRRLAPRVAAWVNTVFEGREDYPIFQRHAVHQSGLPGLCRVLVEPRADTGMRDDGAKENAGNGRAAWRDPLAEAPVQAPEKRALEAQAVARSIDQLAGRLMLDDAGGQRPAGYGDIYVLAASRTGLEAFEAAFKALAIPFVTSRRGGLLETLEAGDLLALLTWLTAPTDNLALARLLKSPICGCDDAALQSLGLTSDADWWRGLRDWAMQTDSPDPVRRAARLLAGWLARANHEPAHDLLDRVFHEGELEARYAAAVPAHLRPGVRANLHALLGLSLRLSGGRYPSLSRLLAELNAQRLDAGDEAPDEPPAQAGDCVRLLTIHAAKGLEAPVVFIIKADEAGGDREHGGVLIDWPVHRERPAHFSLFGGKNLRGRARDALFEQEEAQRQRERLNLLYVAMTRARQALFISGLEDARPGTWLAQASAALARIEPSGQPEMAWQAMEAPRPEAVQAAGDVAKMSTLPLGCRRPPDSAESTLGTAVHRYLELAAGGAADEARLEDASLPAEIRAQVVAMATGILGSPALRAFFDPDRYLSASNELEYLDPAGQRRRIDRLVEFESEVWILDYKTGGLEQPDLALRAQAYLGQMADYRRAMAELYEHKTLRAGLIFADGRLYEIPD